MAAVAQQPKTVQRQQWWKEEIKEERPTSDADKNKVQIDTEKVKEFADTLTEQVVVPCVGTTYKVEVQGTLETDGRFWACPLSSGFIRERLEPLSKQLKLVCEGGLGCKYADMGESSNCGQLLCGHSSENNLWMRGLFVREGKAGAMKLRLIDVGRMEEFPKQKLYAVPDLLSSIPYMAFQCMMFKEKTKISYNARYRFNDLVRKQILNFTCRNTRCNDTGNLVLYGDMETIIDTPPVNINEEIKKFREEEEEKPITTKATKEVKVTISNNGDGKNRVITENSEPKDSLTKTDKCAELLQQLAGPTEGTTYKIEVLSPLQPDGTFWACPISSGFIRETLEPLSDLLKTSILADPDLRKVTDFSGVLCVKSRESNLLSRCTVIKDVQDGRVKVRLIDMGCTEDHPRSKLFQVPPHLQELPYMAFHCSLFEQKVNLSYQERWKFADLCKKKILDFTFTKDVVREGMNLRVGNLVYSVEDPVIDIIDEIKKAMMAEL